MPRVPFMLCADDYALTQGVSRGILDLIESGRLSATGVMTNRPAWRSDARALRDAGGLVDIGLHLNLTQGVPLGPMPRLAANGELPSVGRVIRDATLGQLDLTEVRAEIARQLDAFEDSLGRAPDFIDGHQHVQALPGVRRALLEELVARKLNGCVFLRDSGDAVPRIVARGTQGPKALTVAALSRGFAASAASRGFLTNDGFAGFSAFDASRDYGNDFKKFLVAPGRRHLIMCHPGRIDDELAGSDSVVETRAQEREFLLSSRFTDLLAEADAGLVRWRD